MKEDEEFLILQSRRKDSAHLDPQRLDPLRKSLARSEALEWIRSGNHPVELEIGSNLGDFLLCASHVFPETSFVGIEVAANLAERCAERLLRAGVSNACVVHSEAVLFLHDHVLTESVQRIHIYFPTPYHRALGLTRPLLRRELFLELHRVLVPGGTLNVLVDLKQSARKIRELASPALWKRKRFSPLPLGQPSPFYVGTSSETRYSAIRQIFPFRLNKLVAVS